MTSLWLILCCLLCGCASTIIRENGQVVFMTQADATDITFDTQHTHFHAATLTHSIPTIAGGQAATHTLTGVAGVASAVGIPMFGARHL